MKTTQNKFTCDLCGTSYTADGGQPCEGVVTLKIEALKQAEKHVCVECVNRLCDKLRDKEFAQ